MNTKIDRSIKRAMLILLCAALGAGCSKKRHDDSANDAPPPPQPAQAAQQAATQVQSFAGTYQTNWGGCTLAQQGDVVTGTCARAYTLDCRATGATISCDWTSPMKGTHGKTTLTWQPDGRLSGPWGNGPSTSGGGTWVFTRT